MNTFTFWSDTVMNYVQAPFIYDEDDANEILFLMNDALQDLEDELNEAAFNEASSKEPLFTGYDFQY